MAFCKDGLTVLSLFDGMSCGAIALREAGIPVKQYFASEIDRQAIRQTQHNFPDTIQLGSVTDVRVAELPPIDLLIGGSPCQGFSFAGKQLNFNDPRSSLFFEYVRILHEVQSYNPNVKFLLENVRMVKEFENVITSQLGLFPVMINSALVSAQNRVRLYWTNIRTKTVPHLFGSDTYSDIPQPQDRGIFLCDILEKDVDERFYLSHRQIKNLIRLDSENAASENAVNSIINGQQYCVAFRGRLNPATGQNEQKPEIRSDGKSNTLTTVQKDNMIITFDSPGESIKVISGTIDTRKSGMGFRPVVSGKGACIRASASHQSVCMLVGGGNIGLRHLTPTEWCRLQTIPEWYEWVCGESQIYQMLGNGWTVEVIRHIFQFLNNNAIL